MNSVPPNTPLLNNKNPELRRRSGFAVLGFLLVLFTPPGKFLVGAFDVVAALHMVAGALGIVDAKGGAVVALGHAALLDHRVRQRNGRLQALFQFSYHCCSRTKDSCSRLPQPGQTKDEVR